MSNEFKDLHYPQQKEIASYSRHIATYIQDKYYSRPALDQQEARRDAALYGGASLMLARIWPYFTEDPSEILLSEGQYKGWDNAFGQTKLGDWQGIKEIIQEDARSALDSSAVLSFIDIDDKEAEQRGQSLSNLASLL